MSMNGDDKGEGVQSEVIVRLMDTGELRITAPDNPFLAIALLELAKDSVKEKMRAPMNRLIRRSIGKVFR